jgi:hypothetical protein
MTNDQPCHSQPESSVFPYNMKIEFEDEDNVDAEVIARVHPCLQCVINQNLRRKSKPPRLQLAPQS